MKYRHSEVLENYAKLAADRGLIDTSLPVKQAEETNPRYDSVTIKEIEALYGVKAPGESEKDILDQAHPDPVVLAPAHDKVNGLVENLKERHNIMVGIATKPTNGLLTQHVYVAAKEQLLNELIKVAFLLDRENKAELMTLADSCSERLVKTAVIPPLILAGLVAAGVGLLYTAISQNLHLSQGVVQDCEKALTEIEEAITTYSKHPELKTELAGLIEKIKVLKAAGEKVAAIQMHPATESQTQNATSAYVALQEGKDLEAIKLMTGFAAGCMDMSKLLGDYITILKMRGQQYEDTHSDWLEPLRRGYRMMIPSDMEDAAGALEALQKSCTTATSQMDAMIKLFRELRTKGVESVEKFKTKLQGSDLAPDGPKPVPEPSKDSGKPAEPMKPIDKIPAGKGTV
jgi:hypothetical protein